ncbi:MAG: hypothetical protein Q9170_003803 [Blastenia crenularia]
MDSLRKKRNKLIRAMNMGHLDPIHSKELCSFGCWYIQILGSLLAALFVCAGEGSSIPANTPRLSTPEVACIIRACTRIATIGATPTREYQFDVYSQLRVVNFQDVDMIDALKKRLAGLLRSETEDGQFSAEQSLVLREEPRLHVASGDKSMVVASESTAPSHGLEASVPAPSAEGQVQGPTAAIALPPIILKVEENVMSCGENMTRLNEVKVEYEATIRLSEQVKLELERERSLYEEQNTRLDCRQELFDQVQERVKALSTAVERHRKDSGERLWQAFEPMWSSPEMMEYLRRTYL